MFLVGFSYSELVHLQILPYDLFHLHSVSNFYKFTHSRNGMKYAYIFYVRKAIFCKEIGTEYNILKKLYL